MSEETTQEMCMLKEDAFDFNDLTLESEDDTSWIESVDMNQWRSQNANFNELLVETIIEELLSDKFPPAPREPKDESFLFEYQKFLLSMESANGSENSCYPNVPGTELQF